MSNLRWSVGVLAYPVVSNHRWRVGVLAYPAGPSRDEALNRRRDIASGAG